MTRNMRPMERIPSAPPRSMTLDRKVSTAFGTPGMRRTPEVLYLAATGADSADAEVVWKRREGPPLSPEIQRLRYSSVVDGSAFSTWGSAAKRTWLFHGPLPTGTMDAADFDAAYEWPDVPLFGAQVTSVGDLDGDGTHEVLVGTLGNHFLLFTQPGF